MHGINSGKAFVTETVDTWVGGNKKIWFWRRLLDVISWKEKREREQAAIKQQELQEQEQLQQRMNFVNQEMDAYVQNAIKEIQRQNEEIERQNTTCPNCQGKNVVDHILSWSMESKDTTLNVCHCSDCSNEWLNNKNEENNKTCPKCNGWNVVNRIIKNWYIEGWDKKKWWKIETVCHCDDCSNEWVKQEKKKDDAEYIRLISENLANRLHIIIEDCLYHKYYEDVDPNDENKLNESRVQKFREIIHKYPGFENLSIESLEYLEWLNDISYLGSWNPYKYVFREKIVYALKQLWFKYKLK